MLSFKQFINESADLDTKLKKLGLKRTNKYGGIGKEIGGEIYLHKQYESTLPFDLLSKSKLYLPKDFTYQVVKFNPKTLTFSFIQSNDFDTNEEPSVNGGVTVKADGSIKPFKDAGWIYHHKWLWVADNYKGFDVEKSKERSLKWSSLDGVDKARIGQRKHWDDNVVPRLNESLKLPDKTDYSQKVILPRDTQGILYDGTTEVIPKGTSISIDGINTWRDGSITVVAHYNHISIKLNYDNKSEAENDLEITI